MHHFPVLVAQHLKLDVTGVFEKFLRVNVRRTKGLLRLAARRLVSGEKLIPFAYHAHAASASTCGGLENQRIADARRFFAGCSSPSTTPSLPGIVCKPAVFHSRRAA